MAALYRPIGNVGLHGWWLRASVVESNIILVRWHTLISYEEGVVVVMVMVLVVLVVLVVVCASRCVRLGVCV
jgi:hypothetical protein